MTKAKATAADMNREVELAKARAKARPQEYGRAADATGPQRSDSGAPNPEADVVTVELTREEAEWMYFASDTGDGDPISAAIFDKLRASLERTGK